MAPPGIVLQILETPEQLAEVEGLQRLVWPGSETDVTPVHVLRAAVHNGGLVIGAYAGEQLAGFVFGFPGLYDTPDGPRLKHYSHMLGVHPGFRGQGVGFALKRAQWQMVRHQGIDRITWTYDPLLSQNAWLNIARLGAVCSTYLRDFYGAMRDGLNVGLPSDRFQVDWWVNSKRVERRLSRKARPALKLEDYLATGVPVVESASVGWEPRPPLLLVEIPAAFLALKAAEPGSALNWRMQTRAVFEALFAHGYLVTDFLRAPDEPARSYYALSYGESTL